MRPKQAYCSIACYRRSEHPDRVTQVGLRCATCDAEFSVHRSRAESARYCSVPCANAGFKAERSGSEQFIAHMRSVQQAQVASKEPTRIEVVLYSILDALGIDYEKQHVVGGIFTVDAFLTESRVIVQADGDYWHGRMEQTHKRVRNRVRLDRSQDSYARNRGIGVVRLWGSDLLARPEWCRDQILAATA